MIMSKHLSDKKQHKELAFEILPHLFCVFALVYLYFYICIKQNKKKTKKYNQKKPHNKPLQDKDSLVKQIK